MHGAGRVKRLANGKINLFYIYLRVLYKREWEYSFNKCYAVESEYSVRSYVEENVAAWKFLNWWLDPRFEPSRESNDILRHW